MIFFKRDKNIEKAKTQYRALIAGIKIATENRDFDMLSQAIKDFTQSWMGIIKTERLFKWEDHLLGRLDAREMQVRNYIKCTIEEFEEAFTRDWKNKMIKG